MIVTRWRVVHRATVTFDADPDVVVSRRVGVGPSWAPLFVWALQVVTDYYRAAT